VRLVPDVGALDEEIQSTWLCGTLKSIEVYFVIFLGACHGIDAPDDEEVSTVCMEAFCVWQVLDDRRKTV
jgi:hypothetical protein